MGNYLPSTAPERAQMLGDMGYRSIDDLYCAVAPDMRTDAINLPEGVSELETFQEMYALAHENTEFSSIFRGAGAYWHFIPPLVKSVMAKEKFSTAYTPYQAEISQGILQSIFEYQTMICEITGMDVANASVYDGATAAAEAMFMCQERKRTRVVLSATINPHTLETMQTYAKSRNVEISIIAPKDGLCDIEALRNTIDKQSACVIFQQPNYFGLLEQADTIIELAHTKGAKAVVIADPISLGILKSPGEMGADICVAEGQSLGLPLSFGGPYLGIMASTRALMRRLPGRIVGQTYDSNNNRAFVLTMQAREQHIRREKALSNICSNEALCALGAGVYLACMGAEGLRQAASLSYSKAHYLAQKLASLDGFSLVYDHPFFNEFVTTCPCDANRIVERLATHNILGGLPLSDTTMLWCATEMNSKTSMDRLITLIEEEVM